MAYNKANQTNIDKSDLADYPNGQIKDNDGSDDGTPVARITFSDIFETFDKLMRLAGIAYNASYDNESNGYQYIQALMALSGKNDIVQPLTAGTAVIATVTTPVLILSTIKIETLQLNEILVAKPAADYASQTKLQGSTAGTYLNVSSTAYKANDLVLIQKTSGGVSIVTLATSATLNRLAGEAGYLKAATNLQEITGTSTTVATNPASNLSAFEDRVNGDSSDAFLATDSQNGLLSAEDKTKIDQSLTTRNIGWISGVDVGGGTSGDTYPTSGDITAAVDMGGSAGNTNIRITFSKAMDNLNFYVRMMVESQGNPGLDNDINCPVFIPLTTTTFQISMSETSSGIQSLKIHLEVVQGS